MLLVTKTKTISKIPKLVISIYFNLKPENDEVGSPEVSYKNEQRIEVQKKLIVRRTKTNDEWFQKVNS